jgi:predicted transcriptional regulator
MGTTKTEQFTTEQNKLALMAKALGHPARIAILEHLYKTDGCVCGGIVDEIGLAQATISQHLKALKDVGLIKGNTDGASVCYCIDTNNLINLSDLLSNFIKSGSCGTDCC